MKEPMKEPIWNDTRCYHLYDILVSRPNVCQNTYIIIFYILNVLLNMCHLAFIYICCKKMIVPETEVVNDIPDGMKRLASYVARAFYGPKHCKYSFIIIIYML